MTVLNNPGPKMATTIMARRILGKDIKISTTARIKASTRPPKYPESKPKLAPISAAKKTTTQESPMEIRVP